MTRPKQIEDVPADFAWPDPLVVDIVVERYPDVVDRRERLTLARLHSQTLRDLYAGRDRQAAAVRVELIAFCAARGIAPDRIARVDLAVLIELAHVASTRFRQSPRTRDAVGARIEAAAERVRAAPTPRPASARVPDILRRPAAVSG